MARVRGPFDPEPTPLVESATPAVSVMLGSLITLLPMIASMPLLPPFGLLMLVAWRLGRNTALPVWAPLLLGLFDDLFSGQPLGSAMLLWSFSFLVIDLLDERLVTRDFWQDWLLASGAITGCLIAGRLFALPLAAPVDSLLLLQILVSIILYPLAAQLVAWLDRERTTA